MSVWTVTYTPEARSDLLSFDKSQRAQIQKAINRVRQNPLPATEGGYGKPLGSRRSGILTGCLKINSSASGFASYIVCFARSVAWRLS